MSKKLLAGTVLLLSACYTKPSTVSQASKSSSNLDPSQYTIEAVILYNSDVGLSEPLPYKGGWVGGGGVFENTLETGPRYRVSMSLADRKKDQQFTLTFSGKTATSSVLNFKDCDFVADFGYDASTFHKMNVYFIFDSAQNTLRRVGISSPSNESDATAADCERIEDAASGAKVVYISASSDLKIQSGGKTVSPNVVSKDLSGIQQTFHFHPTVTSKEDINVVAKEGTFPYQVSLKYCVDYFTKIGADIKELASEYVDLSATNVLVDHGYSCCGVGGDCSPRTN